MWSELVGTGRFAGVSGVTAVARDGTTTKRPHLLGVQRGQIMSIDETGQPPILRPRPTPTTTPARNEP